MRFVVVDFFVLFCVSVFVVVVVVVLFCDLRKGAKWVSELFQSELKEEEKQKQTNKKQMMKKKTKAEQLTTASSSAVRKSRPSWAPRL